jgi:peptidyl-tRNA hydrolase, PTH1 family
MRKFLIIGLGNIGTEYEGTRHNIGFDVVDALVQKHEGTYRVDRLALVSEIKYKGKPLTCIKPTTYMNLSGKAVKYWKEKENIPLENCLVILDDLAIPLDKLRLRATGSDAGHNGLKSIQEALLTEKYPKLRFGIGNDFAKGKQVEYVLGKWTEKERPIVEAKIVKCVELIESFAQNGIDLTMSQYNNLTFKL